MVDPCSEITLAGPRFWRSVLLLLGAAVGLVVVGLALTLAFARPAGATPLSRPGVHSTAPGPAPNGTSGATGRTAHPMAPHRNRPRSAPRTTRTDEPSSASRREAERPDHTDRRHSRPRFPGGSGRLAGPYDGRTPPPGPAPHPAAGSLGPMPADRFLGNVLVSRRTCAPWRARVDTEKPFSRRETIPAAPRRPSPPRPRAQRVPGATRGRKLRVNRSATLLGGQTRRHSWAHWMVVSR